MSRIVRRPALRRPRTASGSQDHGYSLIELLVAMSLFTVLLATFMQGVVLMTKNTVRTQSVGNSSDSLRKVFDSMDKQLRYASALNAPARVGNSWYFEFTTTAKVDGVGGNTCTGYKLDTDADTLSIRTWTDGATTLPTWRMLANRIVNDPTTQPPFTFRAADDDFVKQRVAVFLKSQDVRGDGADLRSTFVARNTGVAEETVTNDPTQRVCNATGVRT